MGYRNQPVIQDLYGVEAGAKAFGQVTQALVQGAQQFAKVAEDKRLKKIKEDEAQTRLENTMLLKGEDTLSKEYRDWQNQGGSIEMLNKWKIQANNIAKGDGSYTGGVIDEDNINSIGSLQASALILGKRFTTTKERELLERKKQELEDFLTRAYTQAGGWGSEAEEVNPYIDKAFIDDNWGFRGYEFGDNLGTKFTAAFIANRTHDIPGLTSNYDLDSKTGIQTFTHYMNKDNEAFPTGVPLTASGLGKEGITTITEEGDKYKIVQTYSANFDGNILRPVREARDWKKDGTGKVTDTNGNLLQKYIFQLPTTITNVETDKGKATNKVQAIKQSYMSGQALSDAMYVVLEEEAGIVANGMDLQNQYLYMKNRYGIDLKNVEGYLDKFTPAQRFEYIQNQAKNQMLVNYGAGIGGQGGFKKAKMTDKLAMELLRGKTNGDEALQSIPDQYIVDPEDASKTIKNPAYKEWYDGDHYMKKEVSNPFSDGTSTGGSNTDRAADYKEWQATHLKNFNNTDYGITKVPTDENNAPIYFIPQVGKYDEIKKEWSADYVPSQNEEIALKIYGTTKSTGNRKRIIQVGPNSWQGQTLMQQPYSEGSNKFWGSVGKPSSKIDLAGFLGIYN